MGLTQRSFIQMLPGTERALIKLADTMPRLIKAIEEFTAELRRVNTHYEEEVKVPEGTGYTRDHTRQRRVREY